MKPNFQSMSMKELKAYLLEHRTDTDAFHAIMDKAHEDPHPVWYKDEDMNRFAEIYEEHLKRLREQPD
jgi:hypothetical protein